MLLYFLLLPFVFKACKKALKIIKMNRKCQPEFFYFSRNNFFHTKLFCKAIAKIDQP